MALFEDDTPDAAGGTSVGNSPEFTVSELAGAVRKVIEGGFGLVRVRGEVGRVSRPASGHLYFDLKDQGAVLAAVSWKGQVARMQVRPEEGMEVVAQGRLTTFPGQSKYQLIVDDVQPAGAGALMAMLEKRRVTLAAEGLFDAARKQPIPYLPRVIGVVTSPSGAVIRDILHRLRDRFPRHVLIWPVVVQGQACAAEVAAAIRGFNALEPGGPIPRPDLIIVARGGGSIEDLWGFNEEIVVRAAAESRIPLISAVGHETDTTLIDYAADLRAPTPSAAAELAVPVRADLLATLADLVARQARAGRGLLDRRRQRLADLSRALPRLDALTGRPQQRLDHLGSRLAGALGLLVAGRAAQLARVDRLHPGLLAGMDRRRADRLADLAARAERGLAARIDRTGETLRLRAERLARAHARGFDDAARQNRERRETLNRLAARLYPALIRARARAADRLEALERMRATLGYAATLRRGYAVVRSAGKVLTTRAEAEAAPGLEIEFQDGRLALGARPARKGKADEGQGSLF